MVVALTEKAHRNLSRNFAERNIEKRYLALVTGRRNRPQETIELPLGRHPKYGHKMTVRDDGRGAKTGLRVAYSWEGKGEVFTALEVDLYTGRTHQIRVHLSATGTPVVADPIYSKKWKKYREDRLMLQAMMISFLHPATGEQMTFTAPLADHIRRFLAKWEGPSPEKVSEKLKNGS
jgi:23S rRNA pseudouridine1911/1915/1917 synthase